MPSSTKPGALNAQRISRLRAIHAGDQPEIQQRQLKWFSQWGWLIVGPRPARGRRRTGVLTLKACQVLGVEHDHAVREFLVQDSGYYPAPPQPPGIDAPVDGKRRRLRG